MIAFYNDYFETALTDRAAAELFGVSERTIRNWNAGKIPNPALYELARLKALRLILPDQFAARMTPDGQHLTTANGYKLTASQLLHYGFMVTAYRERLERDTNKTAAQIIDFSEWKNRK